MRPNCNMDPVETLGKWLAQEGWHLDTSDIEAVAVWPADESELEPEEIPHVYAYGAHIANMINKALDYA